MNIEEIKLGNLSTISSGLVVKRKQAFKDSDILKRYRMLTLKSFEQRGLLNENEFEDFESNEILNNKYLTKKGDIIIRLSYPYTAITVSDNEEGILIPSLFAIVRLNDDNILPEYLSIFLNSEYMKKLYVRSSIGSKIQIIKTSMLKDIDVKIHNLERQQKIVEFNKLALREIKLLEQLHIEKTKLHNVLINNVLK